MSYKLSNEDSYIYFGGWESEIVVDDNMILWTDLIDDTHWSISLTKIKYGDVEISSTPF